MSYLISSSLAESTTILNTEVDLHTVENDVVALEDFFKAWLHVHHAPDREHLHLLLPARTTGCRGARSSEAGNLPWPSGADGGICDTSVLFPWQKVTVNKSSKP